MKKTIFLTGSTGIMGAAGLKEISQRLDRFNLTLLVRPSKINRKKLAPYQNNPNIRIIWGDLMNYEDMLNGVNGADYVLHVGGKVSPQCDAYPNETRTVNVTAVQHLVKAIKAQPDPDKVAFVYIGSVAQTGFRPVPYHFGRTGDPLNPSIYDHYALSKCMAERIVVESGLKKWVCLRQTGMLYTEIILKSSDPITFHVPLDGVQEWATTEDSGRLLANVCEDFIPEEFWNRFYNISSGPEYRLTFYDFETKLLKLLSCPPPEKIFDLKWFAIRNFHSYWFTDGDELEKYTHFRANIPLEEYFEKMRGQIPWFFAFAKIVPAFVIRFMMKSNAKTKRFGTLDWLKNDDKKRIAAYFKSRERWSQIPDWDHFDRSVPSNEPIIFDHGYDESKPLSELDIEDMKKAAIFRGGKCLSETMVKGDMRTPLEWECQFGHKFKASPTLILLGGHWCPDCFPTPWNYDEIAKGNPFFAQAWYASHDKDEHNVYEESIFDGWEK